MGVLAQVIPLSAARRKRQAPVPRVRRSLTDALAEAGLGEPSLGSSASSRMPSSSVDTSFPKTTTFRTRSSRCRPLRGRAELRLRPHQLSGRPDPALG